MDETYIKKLLKSSHIEPSFFINFLKVDRYFTVQSDPTLKLNKKRLLCWKIENEKLIEANVGLPGIFFDSNCYIIQCILDLTSNEMVTEKWLLFYWRGEHSTKGFTPLPPGVEDDYPMDRVCQWSEPAIFFHCFDKPLVVFSGDEASFDVNCSHLLMIKGELDEETHLYEVPCRKGSLRSKASFLLIDPKDKQYIYWHGKQVAVERRQKLSIELKPHEAIKKFCSCWESFTFSEVEEGSENCKFSDNLEGDFSDYWHVKSKSSTSPKLIYLNSIGNQFCATEIDYPLRSVQENAAFPFLQSHLYTAPLPALFILDDGNRLWIWEGTKSARNQCDGNDFKNFLDLYCNEKEELRGGKSVEVQYVFANEEPLEFKSLFPLWTEKK